jgi:hypothetical protein
LLPWALWPLTICHKLDNAQAGKKNSPHCFELPDMRMLVRSQLAQRCLVNSHNGKAQRYGAKAYWLRRF